jgi:hypothetical protein
VKSYTLIQLTIFGGSQTILRIKDCKTDDIVKEASMNEASKQSRDPKNQLDTRRYDDKSQKVL